MNLSRLKRRILSHYRLTRYLLLGIALIFVVLVSQNFLFPLFRLTKDFLFGPVSILSVIIPHGPQLKNSDGRTNILILGIGGQAHDGPDLSDTMIVASIPMASPSAVALISIPRDIYLDTLQGKINSAYSTGVENDASHSGAGLIMAKASANQVTGLPIHYGLRIDFSAFVQIIDLFGGVDINVEHTLEDNSFPIEAKADDPCSHTPAEIDTFMATNPTDPQQWEFFPCRYEKLLIPAGLTHMNGQLALKYVRSRHAQGDEGSDFARSRRQELLISALKNKVFSTETFLNPGKVEQVYNLLKSHIDTDIKPDDTNNFLKLALKYRSVSFKPVVLDMSFFDNPPIDARGWILVPKDGTFTQIHRYIKDQLKN